MTYICFYIYELVLQKYIGIIIITIIIIAYKNIYFKNFKSVFAIAFSSFNTTFNLISCSFIVIIKSCGDFRRPRYVNEYK